MSASIQNGHYIVKSNPYPGSPAFSFVLYHPEAPKSTWQLFLISVQPLLGRFTHHSRIDPEKPPHVDMRLNCKTSPSCKHASLALAEHRLGSHLLTPCFSNSDTGPTCCIASPFSRRGPIRYNFKVDFIFNRSHSMLLHDATGLEGIVPRGCIGIFSCLMMSFLVMTSLSG